jgi:colicin import membrane protein
MAKVRQNWLNPVLTSKGLSCDVEVKLIPGGEVILVKIIKSSGNAVFDASVERAVYKASPLPVPKEVSAFDSFRRLRFNFKP